LCVDDHPIVREGLTAVLREEPDLVVIATAANGGEAVERYRQLRPDITLMDLRLPLVSGFEAIRAIRQIDPAARIVVLTMYHGDEDVHRAMQAGAAAYLLKDTLADNL